MNFLAPLFLLGALTVALPVVFHLIRRSARERMPFSSLMFLNASPPRLTRRSRLEHWLLLALRCAVICLLALGFARPYLPKAMFSAPPAGTGERTVILLDTSASMRRENLWPEAKAKAEKLVRGAGAADQVAVFAFDHRVQRLVTFDQWAASPAGNRAAAALQPLAALTPGWGGTDFGAALTAAAEALEENAGAQAQSWAARRIVLISDLQEGGRVDSLQAYEWPKNIRVVIEALKAKRPTNAGLELLADTGDATATNATVRLRVSNAGESKREQFKVGWATENGAFAGKPLDIYVPPGQSRVVSLPSEAAHTSRLVLRGDDEEFDNTIYFVPPEPARITVIYPAAEKPEDTKQPLYYLQRAFQSTGRQAVRIVQPSDKSAAVDKADQQITMVTDLLPADASDAVGAALKAGRTVVCALRAPAMGPMLARWLGVDALPVEEAQLPGYAMLGDIDFRHPVLAPFADPRFSDFTKIHFWKYRRLDLRPLANAHVLARFDNGDPALVETAAGQGKLLILTSGWQPEDSQLALSSKFVPLLYSVLDWSGCGAAPAAIYHVGDAVAVGGQTNAAATIRLPTGGNITSDAARFTQTQTPGVYALSAGGRERAFAVNVAAAESRTSPLSSDDFERVGAPVWHAQHDAAAHAAAQARQGNAELESHQKLWRWLIVAALGILLGESWLAGWMMRRPAAQPEATS